MFKHDVLILILVSFDGTYNYKLFRRLFSCETAIFIHKFGVKELLDIGIPIIDGNQGLIEVLIGTNME